MPRTLVLLVTAVMAIALHAQPNASAWKTWRTKACSLNYPGDWAFDNSGSAGTTVAFYAPSDSGDTFRENVNLVVQDVKGMDLTTYAQRTESEVRTHLGEASIIRSETERTPAEVHTLEYAGKLNGRDMRFKQTLRIVNGKAYVLTYTADPATYDEYLYLADAILNSFAVSK
jgi:serine/threonine-protein kinase